MSTKKRTREQQLAALGLLVALFGIMMAYELVSDASKWHISRALLGIGAWPLALFLLALGVGLIFWPLLQKRWQGYWYTEAFLGMLLLYLAGLAMASMRVEASDLYVAALHGRGGGLVGWALSEAALRYLGLLPAWGWWLALSLVGLYFLYLYTPLRRLSLPGIPILWEVPKPPRSSSAPAQAQQRQKPRAPTKASTSKSRSSSAARPPAPKPPPSKRTSSTRPAKPSRPKRRQLRRPSVLTPNKPAPAASPERPPLNLLRPGSKEGTTLEQARAMAKIIEDTLAGFDIPARVVEVRVGPTVTQFGVQPGVYEKNGQTFRVRIQKIVALEDDLALALAASPVRIEAPVPGKPYIGIEVPNPEPALVTLRSVLEDPAFQEIQSPLALPLGRDVSGEAVVADLHKLPHLLIAGATGSGKSVAMNAIITGLLMNNGPDQVKMLMVDPKRVEFPGYNGIPHLLAPVVTDPDQASGALSWLLKEMDERYQKFAQAGVRNIQGYNAQVATAEALPYVVMLVDELADLMMTAAEEIEKKLVRLAQMARATGIHLVIATQRPSVDVVTGLIKANFPARLAFAVSSQVDSKVILDEPGAEKLLGRGDGLFMSPDSPEKRRLQGCFVSDEEIRAVVGWWLAHSPHPVHDPTQARFPWADMMVEEANADDLLYQAVEAIQGRQTISVSALQRMLNIGYPRAARLMEALEAEGMVVPDEQGRGWVVLNSERHTENGLS